METPHVAIINGIVFTGEEFVDDCVVLLAGNRVAGLVSREELPDDVKVIDAQHHYVAPGFIDLQIYGGGDYLFSANPTREAMDGIAEALVKSGTTSFLITMATNTTEVVDKALEVMTGYQHPALLGLHLEGPYLNPAKRGAHPAEYIRQPDITEIADLLGKGKGRIRMMTIAPERFDAETIQLLLEHGIVLSAGHSNATLGEAQTGFGRGIAAATHLFNAMSPFHHRDPGLPGAVFLSDNVKASIIVDGIHVDYHTVDISKKLMNDRLFLITDAVVEVNTGTYTHVFQGDRYTLPDGTLSGSALTMMQAVANCVQHVDIPLAEALRMASLYPAALIGAADLGRIVAGSLANLVIFDAQYSVKLVLLEGKPQ